MCTSGKSTYLKQIGVLLLMAHIGSYVPAEFASFRLTDQVMTRMSPQDDIESNRSTFFTEMKEVNYILRNVTDHSVVLLDELGRSTSNIDGIGIAWAVSEELLQKACFVLFATHYMSVVATVRLSSGSLCLSGS